MSKTIQGEVGKSKRRIDKIRKEFELFERHLEDSRIEQQVGRVMLGRRPGVTNVMMAKMRGNGSNMI